MNDRGASIQAARFPRIWNAGCAALLLSAAVVCGFGLDGASAATTHPHRCPKVEGLSVRVARARAAKAHCAVRLEGAKVEQASLQRVGKQRVTSGPRGKTVTLWVEPLCPNGSSGPEPTYTKGATALETALYAVGGMAHENQKPECIPTSAGTVTVTSPAGEVVATQQVAREHVATIPLPAGEYTVVGTYANAISNGSPAQSFPEHVTVMAGETVRQDVLFTVP